MPSSNAPAKPGRHAIVCDAGRALVVLLAAVFVAGPGHAFEPAPLPELITETDEDAAPFYLFLFTHTEDPFNHRPSERRYSEFAPLVSRLAATHPEQHIVWKAPGSI